MKKTLLFFVVFLGAFLGNGQQISSKKWTDLFSYNHIIAIKENAGKIIAATQNGIFYYNISNGEITKLSKTNGLHEVKISAFDYNPDTKIAIVGYESGAFDVIDPNGISYIVDIPIAQGYIGQKRVNHISITGDQAVISVNYGVSIFKIPNKEFGLTSFFLSSGVYEAANEATIKGDKVFVATNSGIKTHLLNVTFPDYSSWTTQISGVFSQVDSDANALAFSSANTVYYENGSTFSAISQGFNMVKDVVVNGQKIIVTDELRVYVFSTNGILLDTKAFGEECNTANIINSVLYGGTKLSGIKDSNDNFIKPDGPYNNFSYKISLLGDQIWVATGALDSYNVPIYHNLGYYHFNGSRWIYPEYFKNNPISFNTMDVQPNPANPSEVFFVNYTFIPGVKGIYKMVDDAFVKVYKNNDAVSQYYNRPVGIGFDESNNLVVTMYLIENSSIGNGYYLYNKSSDDFTLIPVANAVGSQRPIMREGIIYIPCPFYNAGGLIMRKYDKNLANSNSPTAIITTNNNLPIKGVVSAALDNNDDLWIGTREGLRVFSDPTSIFSDSNAQTEPIIIEQNGIAEELFRNSEILQIAVDSGNHKWVSVAGGGVYYLSPNGEQTLKHFTKENSPLPNNGVTDIKVDERNGKVYFVTSDGIVIYQGDVSNVNSNFGNVVVYPNPVVQSNFRGNVVIRGLAQKTNIRITDSAGNLVHQAVARGGFYEWDLNNQRGTRVASGMYFVLMTNEDATDTKTAKIAVVN